MSVVKVTCLQVFFKNIFLFYDSARSCIFLEFFFSLLLLSLLSDYLFSLIFFILLSFSCFFCIFFFLLEIIINLFTIMSVFEVFSGTAYIYIYKLLLFRIFLLITHFSKLLLQKIDIIREKND